MYKPHIIHESSIYCFQITFLFHIILRKILLIIKLVLIENFNLSGAGGRGALDHKSNNMTAAPAPNVGLLTRGTQGSYYGEDQLELITKRKYVEVTKKCFGKQLTYDCYAVYDIYGLCSNFIQSGPARGGPPGEVKVIELGASSLIQINTRPGEDGGVQEIHGHGGNSASVKIRMKYSSKSKMAFSGSYRNYEWNEINREPDYTCAQEISTRSNTNKQSSHFGIEPENDDESLIIGSYLAFAREQEINKIKQDDIWLFVQKLLNINQINYTTHGFANELLLLEGQYYKLKDNVNLEKYYCSLRDRIAQSSLNGNTSMEDRKVISYVYTAVLGKCFTPKADRSIQMPDLHTFLNKSKAIISRVNDNTRSTIITETQNEYCDSLQIDIEKPLTSIGALAMSIFRITQNMETHLDKILNNIIRLRNGHQFNDDVYNLEQKRLELQMTWLALLPPMYATVDLAKKLLVYGKAVHVITTNVSQIGTGLLRDQDQTLSFKLSNEFNKLLIRLSQGYNEMRENAVNNIDVHVQQIQFNLHKYPDIFQDTIQTIEGLQIELGNIKFEDSIKLHSLVKIRDALYATIEEKQIFLSSRIDRLTDEEMHALDTIEIIDRNLKIFLETNFYNKYIYDSEKLNEIWQILEKSTMQYEDTVLYTMETMAITRPIISDIMTKIASIEAEHKTIDGYVDLNKWRIEETLHRTKYILQTLYSKFKDHESLVTINAAIDDFSHTIIEIFDRMQTYQDLVKMKDFLQSIESKYVNNANISDPKYVDIVKQLNTIITSNVVLNTFEMTADIFKQSIFPFASNYFDNLPASNEMNTLNETVDLQQHLISQITVMDNILTNFENDDRNKYLVADTFNVSRPIYRWQYEQYSLAINQLLSGKPVRMHADITKGLPLNVLQFTSLNLVFENPNPAQQKKLNNILPNWDVSMTLDSNCYYHCDGYYYVMNGPETTIEFSIARNDSKPLRSNEPYSTVITSPYTIWTVQLKMGNGGKTNGNELKALAKNTNLVLVGSATYFENNDTFCENDLNRFYQPNYSISNTVISNTFLSDTFSE